MESARKMKSMEGRVERWRERDQETNGEEAWNEARKQGRTLLTVPNKAQAIRKGKELGWPSCELCLSSRPRSTNELGPLLLFSSLSIPSPSAYPQQPRRDLSRCGAIVWLALLLASEWIWRSVPSPSVPSAPRGALFPPSPPHPKWPSLLFRRRQNNPVP
jgi:hypothetical protein